jgi:hypothetical protein
MPPKTISPNPQVAKQILDGLWEQVLSEESDSISPDIHRLIESSLVSVRFSLPTQLLGKLTDSKLDALCLQKGDGSVDSLWDPRSFCSKVVVPWVMANESVLGTSADPYVSLPLRKPRLKPDPGGVRGKEDWILLYKVLNEVQTRNNEKFTQECFLHVLRSIKRKLAESTFEYAIPSRVSLGQTRRLINAFLSDASGGDRALSVAAALFKTIGHYFSLYSEVKRFVINASDESTGSAADIECRDAQGALRLAIEVKDRNLTLTDVKSGVKKSRKASISELLFNAPKITLAESNEIEELFEKTWASGTNLYYLSIDDLIKVTLSLTGENGRVDFLRNVGGQLDEFNTQPANRRRWKQLLDSL